jgi:hypothetical protein
MNHGSKFRRRGPRSWALSGAGLLVVALAILALLQRSNHRVPIPVAGPVVLSTQALMENLEESDRRRDWEGSLYWAERIGAVRPRDSGVLLSRGSAWSNYGIGQRQARAIPRPAVRTSLERTACQIRAFGLVDSAAIFARNYDEWIGAVQQLGRLQEVQGLPGDALLAFELIRRRVRGEPVALLRTHWLRAMLHDPVHPDTSEWDRRMRGLGLQ